MIQRAGCHAFDDSPRRCDQGSALFATLVLMAVLAEGRLPASISAAGDQGFRMPRDATFGLLLDKSGRIRIGRNLALVLCGLACAPDCQTESISQWLAFTTRILPIVGERKLCCKVHEAYGVRKLVELTPGKTRTTCRLTEEGLRLIQTALADEKKVAFLGAYLRRIPASLFSDRVRLRG